MMENSIMEIKQKKGLKRNTIDKFYTKQSIVIQCIEMFKKYISIEKDDIIIEPSAGNGSFIEEIKKGIHKIDFRRRPHVSAPPSSNCDGQTQTATNKFEDGRSLAWGHNHLLYRG